MMDFGAPRPTVCCETHKATRPKWHPRRSPHPWVPEISQDWLVGNAGSFLWVWEEGIQKNYGQLKWENAGYPYGLSLCI